MKLKIAMTVHGRFHAFDLARGLLQRGHAVTIFTNYPKWAVRRFGISGEHVRSFWIHGLLTRASARLQQAGVIRYPEAHFHRLFGQWASTQLQKEQWDVIHCWSGVAEEPLQAMKGKVKLRLMIRGSAHICTQARLLDEEASRTGTPQDRPSPWMVAREQREYELADKIAVLSSFAFNSFVAEGVPSAKLRLLPLGARLDVFRPLPEVIMDRQQRIVSGQPLRVLYVGALSFRKGMWDLACIAQKLSGSGFEFRFVGPASPETESLISDLQGKVSFVAKRPQSDLPQMYAWGDIFIFPTIEDGYAVVLSQASAAGLPILTTTNCAGPDFIRDGQTGWVLPIRTPEAFIARLQWCAEHRPQLAEMSRQIPSNFQPRDWSTVAYDFERICHDNINESSLESALT